MKDWMQQWWQTSEQEVIEKEEIQEDLQKEPEQMIIEDKDFVLKGLIQGETLIGPVEIENLENKIFMNFKDNALEGALQMINKSDEKKNVLLNFLDGKLHGECSIEGKRLFFKDGSLISIKDND